MSLSEIFNFCVFSLNFIYFYFFLFVNFWRDSSAKNDSIIFLSVIHLQSWCYKLIRSFFRRLQWRFFEECPSLFFPFNECEWKTGSHRLQIVKKSIVNVVHTTCALYFSHTEVRVKDCVEISWFLDVMFVRWKCQKLCSFSLIIFPSTFHCSTMFKILHQTPLVFACLMSKSH